MKPIIKIKNNSSKETENVVYNIKGSQHIPDEIKNLLVSMSSIVKMELIAYLTKVNTYLKTKKGSEEELKRDCQKYINLLRTNKGGVNGTINRNIGTRNPLPGGLDGFTKR